MNVIKALMPKEHRFFDLFAAHAETLIAASEALVRLFTGAQPIAEACKEIADVEHRADDVTRDVLIAVRRSFITPFDRSAITALTSAMDNAVDETWKTATAITLYDLTEFDAKMGELAALAAEGAKLVSEAVPLLSNVGRNGTRLHQITEGIVRLEGRGDDLHFAGLKELVGKYGDDGALEFFKRREVYSHLERVLDRLEDVADEIHGIVIDHA